MSRKVLFIFIVLLIVPVFGVFADSLKYVPLDDSIYDVLEEGYARGLIDYLPQMRPYTEKRVVRSLKVILNKLSDNTSDRIIRKKIVGFLDRCKYEEGLFRSVWDEKNRASVNFRTEINPNLRIDSPLDIYLQNEIFIEPEIALSDTLYMGGDFSFEINFLRYNILPFKKFYEPGLPDYPNYAFFLTRGIDTFNFSPTGYVPGEADIYIFNNNRSQISMNFGYGIFTFGKDNFSWGPSPLCNLQLSMFSHSYDFLQLMFPLSDRGSFSWMTGILLDKGPGSSNTRKMISAHRAEFQFFDWFMFSLYESVIYSYRFELSYLNPLSIYVSNEIRLGDQDNKLGGVDLIFRFLNSKVYISFFADDWDMAAPLDLNYYHNEWGGLGGIEMYDLFPNLSLLFEAIYLSHWMYTHRDDLADVASNFNRYTNYGSHLGHFLEPNSGILILKGNYVVSRDLKVGSSFWFTMHGRGDVYTPPVWSEEKQIPTWPYYDFIDGVIEYNYNFTLFTDFVWPDYRSKFHIEYSVQYTDNVNNVKGDTRWDHLLSLKYTLRYF